MGDVVEWPRALANSADDPGHSPASAVAAVNAALAGVGELRVTGRALGPWRQARPGALALLAEGDVRVKLRWAGDGDLPAWPSGATVAAVGRWWVAEGELVLDSADVVVLVDLAEGTDPAP